MLKIAKEIESTTGIRINLYGKFTGEYVQEVEKALTDATELKRMTIDLSNVTLVDREAMKFLSQAKLKSLTLVNTPSYVQRWIEVEANHSR